MKIPRIILLNIIFLVLLIPSSDIFARGAGRGFKGGLGFRGFGSHLGHRGPLGSNAIGALIAIVLMAIILVLFFYFRKRFVSKLSIVVSKASQSIYDASKSDKFWNEEQMLRNGIQIFYDIIHGYKNKDWRNYSEIIDERIIENLEKSYDKLKSKNQIIEFKHCKIHKRRIVKAIDHENDKQDQYSIYLTGVYVKIIQSIKTQDYIRETINFNHVYVFRRNNQKWILKEFIDDISKKKL